MIRWFKSLSTYRKVVLFLAGGMVTLVFDAFVAHFSWNNHTMKWNQAIPIVYGMAAALLLGAVGLLPLKEALTRKIGVFFGAIGLVVGGLGVYFHAKSLLEGMDADTTGLDAIGKLLASGPPIFAPASFAGVGLLLLVLPSLIGAQSAAQRD
jgi:hypothetical protein